jgi:hypothetical protein
MTPTAAARSDGRRGWMKPYLFAVFCFSPIIFYHSKLVSVDRLGPIDGSPILPCHQIHGSK